MKSMVPFGREKTRLVDASQALPGQPDPLPVPTKHAVFTDRRIVPPRSPTAHAEVVLADAEAGLATYQSALR